MKKEIKLGYEVGTAKEVLISPAHMIVTGMTQLSGKTTTLEALIDRSEGKAIVFKTKIGEKSFMTGTVIPPFFRDRSDYEFVKSLIEAYAKEKLFLEKGTLMTLCKGSKDLIEIKRRIDEKLHPLPDSKVKPLRGIQEEIYVRLEHYLENLIPQIKYANFSAILNLQAGINIMNLEQFSEEAQSLIIQSTAEEVLKKEHGVILVIPEAWKFLPQKYNNPCKRSVEAFIRQGATNQNFVWIDSQDMSGVDKIPLKSISTWILGYQAERNEVKHTLDQISLPKKSKPKEEDIMNLRKGHFYISSYDGVQKVYVQPKWMSDDEAIEIAHGNKDVDDITFSPGLRTEILKSNPPYYNGMTGEEEFFKPKGLSDYPGIAGSGDKRVRLPDPEIVAFKEWVKKEFKELRDDFFGAISAQNIHIREVYEAIDKIKPQVSEHEIDEIVAKVMQKVALTTQPVTVTKGDGGLSRDEMDTLVKNVLARVPKGEGQVVYELAPLEMIKREFIQEAKDKILADVASLSDKGKKILKYVESQGKGCNQTQIIEKLFFLAATSGGTRGWVSKECGAVSSLGLLKKDKNAIMYPNLKGRIGELLNGHDAKPEEVENLYNHIIVEMLK